MKDKKIRPMWGRTDSLFQGKAGCRGELNGDWEPLSRSAIFL